MFHQIAAMNSSMKLPEASFEYLRFRIEEKLQSLRYTERRKARRNKKADQDLSRGGETTQSPHTRKASAKR